MLEQTIDRNKFEIDELEKKKRTIEKEMQEIEEKKKGEIKELTTYIDTMHSNFATMLKKTLEKMKDRISKANEAWEQE